jgi:chromosome partitioning protein
MADVIAVLNQKGGAGKTTLATNLACVAVRSGLRTLLADADPQGTARNWRDHGPEDGPFPAVVGADNQKLGDALDEIAPAFDCIIIDGPPGVSGDGPGKLTAAALKASDLVLIPVRPSAADVWATSSLVELVQARRDAVGTPRAAFVVSSTRAGTNLAAEVDDALNAFELPVLSARTGTRVAYPEALGAGVSVMDLEPSGKAAKEIDAIATEIKDRFHVFEETGA